MGQPRRAGEARLIGALRRDRSALLVTTALTAAAVSLFALPTHAQLAPNTQPTGGVVVAGSARIAASPTTTTITQSSGRAAVNWQSFNVGLAATVNFVQPSAKSVTLNRVLAADPSQIAGHIHANGGIVLTNPAGIVFTHGAEVNAASVLVSAAGISNRNFMAGRMQFDIPPKPGASIINAGTITVKSAGLAALVAPQVANSGVISAKLGQVILAGGAAAETLDLYGDGLVSLDVTPEAHAVRLANGAHGTALVTNSGTIIAAGGNVQLTATQADGLVQDLVDAGGTIAANSLGGHSGTIIITGIGGSIRIPGTLMAEGKAAGTTGGAIVLDATGTVALTGSARVDASGNAGGGTVAVGTTLARARGGPGTTAILTANAVTVAPRARIVANATGDGDGGHVTVLSLGATAMAGQIEARGGRQGGNGGSVEISGENLSLDGHVDTSAPLGATGSILLDPYDLEIVATGTSDSDVTATGVAFGAGGTAAGDLDTVSASAIEALKGDVTLQALHDLEINANLTLNQGTQSLLVEAGNNVTVDPGVSVFATGSIEMDAASAASSQQNAAGMLTVQGTVHAGGNLTLSAGSGGIVINTFAGSTPGSVIGNSVVLNTINGPVDDSAGSITATTLSGTSAGASLTGTNNIATLAGFDASQGSGGGRSSRTFDLQDQSSLTVTGAIIVSSGSLLEIGANGLTLASGSSLVAPAGNVDLNGGTGPIVINGAIGSSGAATALAVTAGGAVFAGGATLNLTTLSGSSAGASFTNLGNNIGTLATYNSSAGGTFNLEDKSPLTVSGQVIVASGSLLAIEADALSVNGGALTAPNGTVQLAPFTATNAVALIETGSAGLGTLAITKADLDAITAAVLEVGMAGGGAISIGNAGDNVTIPSVATLLLESGSSVTEGGALIVSALAGSVGSATLDSSANAIGTLGQFVNASGGFSLVESKNHALLISGALTVPNGNTITLSADGLALAPSGLISAAGGTVTLTSAKPGLGLFLITGQGAASVGTLALGSAALDTAAIDAGTLVIGAGNGGNIAVSGPIDMPAVGLLDVLSSGEFAETAEGSLEVAALTANVASTSLIGNNVIGALDAVTSPGGFTLTNARNLTLAGLLDAGSNSAQINDPGFGMAEAGGSVTADTFSGSASTADLAGLNHIGTVAGFAASSGGLTLVEASGQSLLVSGAVSVPTSQTLALTADGIAIGPAGSLAGATVALAPATQNLALDLTTGLAAPRSGTFSLGDATPNTATITAATLMVDNGDAGISITGPISMPDIDLLDLLSGGALSETAADSLAVGTLTANVESASLIGNNTIATLAGFTLANGGLNLHDEQGLAIAGLLNAPGNTVSFTIDNSGSLSEQGGGVISAGTLTGSAASVTLSKANEIGTLGGFVAPGGLSLTDQQALTISGALNAGTGVANFVINGGSLQESGVGTITSGVLSGSAANVVLNNANSVGTLGAFSSSGGFSLTETGGMTLVVAGAVSLMQTGQTIALTTDGLDITSSGSLSAPGGTVKLTGTTANHPIALLGIEAGTAGTLSINNADLALISAATLDIGSANAGPILIGAPTDEIVIPNSVTSLVLQSEGAISEGGSLIATAATLSGFAGSASLPAPGNSLGALGSFTALGGFTFTNAGNLLLEGSLDAGAATADLTSVSGGIMEQAGPPAGVINAGTLVASAPGPIVLAEANAIATLGSISAHGGFTLDNPGNFLIAGNLDAGNAIVLLTSNRDAVENGGSITAGLLSGSLAAATLGGANAITDIGAFTAHGGLSLTNEEPLSISGAVDIGNGAVSFAINGASLLETASGVLTAGEIEGSAAGAALANSANTVATLGAFNAPGGLTLAVANGLAIAGAVNTGAGAIDLMSGGSIAEIAGGFLSGGELTGFAGQAARTRAAGTASFTNPNTIVSLGDFTALGGFSLADTGSLALLGALDAGTANVALTGGAAVTEPTGRINAMQLAGALSSAVLGGANTISNLANFSAPGGLSLTNGLPLVLTGPVSVGSAEAQFTISGNLTQTMAGFLTAGTLVANAGMISLADSGNAISALGGIASPGGFTIATATGLAIEGTVNAAAQPIVLVSNGNIGEIAGGTLVGAALTGSANAASFGNVNRIGELGNFTAPGGFAFDNAGDLPVVGLIDAGPATALLIAGGSLVETSATLLGQSMVGVITAGTLTGSAGAVTLGNTANKIADLGAFRAGAFNLTDGENLTVSGTVAGNPIGLAVVGNLTLGSGGSGVLESGGPVTLNVSGAISEPDGAIDATSLSGSAASASLGGANHVPVLDAFSTTGSFLFNANEQVLTVNGPIVTGSANLASTGSLVLAGLVSGAGVTLSGGGPITQSGGAIMAANLSGTGTSATLSGANRIDALASFSTPGTLLLTDSAPLTVSGPVNAAYLGLSNAAAVSFTGATDVGTLNIGAGGSITEASGSVTAGLLEGNAAGLAQFGPDAPAGTASIATLGPFTVANGTFTLTDSIPLTITGPLDANYFAITAPGSIVLMNTSITTLGLPPSEQSGLTPTRPGSFFDVTTPGGKLLGIGRTTIDPPAGPDTVRIQLNQAGGLISFADLVAPTTNLILDTGAGTAIGTIDIGALIVIGNLGSSSLSGTVANLSGLVASSKATISPFQSPHYRLNSCPLMSVNCVFIAPEQVPQGNPLSGIAIVMAPPSQREIDLLLPNVAAQDY